MPEFIQGHNVILDGQVYQADNGELYYQPVPQNSGLYILGHHSVGWVDLIGSLAFLGVLAGITIHGGLRVVANMRQPKHDAKTEKVYMYTIYERLWHWVQTAAIVLLLFTGLIIHKPDTFGIFSFTGVVIVHNVLALLLAINAGLSLFYHLASGEIKQYIPRPRGFFDQMITQAKFYIGGIFKGEEHPFEKTVHKKLNPLQQITYFGILNVLLPLQGITGILIWGAQRWPDIAESLGGLPFLAPLHTLIAWLFASFIVAHVYLTTTGHTPTAGIQAMMMGWEEVEILISENDDHTPETEDEPETEKGKVNPEAESDSAGDAQTQYENPVEEES
jgi:thiosulfate reductase cytochrome b subunit